MQQAYTISRALGKHARRSVTFACEHPTTYCSRILMTLTARSMLHKGCGQTETGRHVTEPVARLPTNSSTKCYEIHAHGAFDLYKRCK